MLVSLVLAIIWGAGAGALAIRWWEPTGAEIARERDRGMRGCATRYTDADARNRCEILFETQYVMERNVAIFTRMLIAVAPLAGVGLWALVRRRAGGRSRRR